MHGRTAFPTARPRLYHAGAGPALVLLLHVWQAGVALLGGTPIAHVAGGRSAVPLGVFHRVLNTDSHAPCIHCVWVFAGRERGIGHAGEHVTLRAPVWRRANGARGDLAAVLPAVMRRSWPRRADMHTAFLAMACSSFTHGMASFRRTLYLYYGVEVHCFGQPHARAGFAILRCSLPTGRTRAFASREVFLPTHRSPAKIIPFICSCRSKLCEAFDPSFQNLTRSAI